MKRIFCIFLLALVLCLLAACGQPTDEDADTADEADAQPTPAQPILVGVVVDTPNLNLRVAPSQEARIIDNVVAGTMLRVASAEAEEEWYQVTVRGDTAYVYADYLYVSPWLSGEEVTLGTVLKDQDQVQLRSEASAGAEVVTTAVGYQQFVVLQENVSDQWHKVDYKGSPAYIPAGSLKMETVCIEDALW